MVGAAPAVTMLRALSLGAILKLSLGSTQMRKVEENYYLMDGMCVGYDLARDTSSSFYFDELHFVADAGSYASYSTSSGATAPGYCGASLTTCDGYTASPDADGVLSLTWDIDLAETSASVRVCNTAGSTVTVNCVCCVSPLYVGAHGMP